MKQIKLIALMICLILVGCGGGSTSTISTIEEPATVPSSEVIKVVGSIHNIYPSAKVSKGIISSFLDILLFFYYILL